MLSVVGECRGRGSSWLRMPELVQSPKTESVSRMTVSSVSGTRRSRELWLRGLLLAGRYGPEVNNGEGDTGRDDRSRNEQSKCEDLSEECDASECGQQRNEELCDGTLSSRDGSERV